MWSIKPLAERKGIKALYHFTKVSNLDSILTLGLFPLTEKYNHVDLDIQEDIRLTECSNAISVSIGFPNYKYFYKMRIENPSDNWVVLALDPRILWEKDCSFCYSNAIKTRVRLNLNEYKNTQSFERMFKEYPRLPSRNEMGLTNDLPTDPQAEVLVYGKIESHFIKNVFFENRVVMNEFELNFYKPYGLEYKPYFFDRRVDWAYWQEDHHFA